MFEDDDEDVFACIGKPVQLENDTAGTIIDLKITNIPCCAMLVTFIIQSPDGISERSSMDFRESNGVFLLK